MRFAKAQKNFNCEKRKRRMSPRRKWTEAVTIMTISKLIAECYYQKCNSLKFFFSRSLSRLMRAEIPKLVEFLHLLSCGIEQFVIPGIA